MAVYFIQSGYSGPVKIGYTTDVEARLKDLSIGNPEHLTLLRQIAGDRDTEIWLHGYFGAHHIRGEWFHFREEMMDIDPTPFLETTQWNRAVYRRMGALALVPQRRIAPPPPPRVAPSEYQIDGQFCRPCGLRVTAEKVRNCGWNCAARRLLGIAA